MKICLNCSTLDEKKIETYRNLSSPTRDLFTLARLLKLLQLACLEFIKTDSVSFMNLYLNVKQKE